MDLSFEEENNFYLPDPTGQLDFTEDEDRLKNENKLNDDQMNVSIKNESQNELKNEKSDIDVVCDSSMNRTLETTGDNFETIEEKIQEHEFTKPIINQNLILNRNAAKLNKNQFNKFGQEPVTPALIKRKQFKPWFNSPTDSCLSPCTQKLFKNKKAI